MTSKSSIKLGLLAKEIGAELKGDPDLEVYGINTLLEAKRDEVSFLIRDHFLSELSKTNAAAVIVSKSKKDLIFSRCLLIGENPHLMYAKTTQVFKSLNEGEVKPSMPQELLYPLLASTLVMLSFYLYLLLCLLYTSPSPRDRG